jgi:hypothetical protein
MANTKLSAFLSLLLVFASGIVVGSVGYHVYNTKLGPPPAPQHKRSPEEVRKNAVEEMTREVRLDSDQVVQLKQIYDDTRANFDEVRADYNTKLHQAGQAIHDQQVEKVKKILRPDQIPLYDALRQKHEADRKKWQDQHKGGEIRKDQ